MTDGAGVETELKYLRPDLAGVRQRLTQAGATLRAPRALETNVVFDDADESLRRSDRLLRLRNGHELTAKVPRPDERYKSRGEFTVDIAEGEVEALLAALDFQPRWRYEKWREGWDLDGMYVTLDELPFIGPVVEIEGDRERIDQTARRLGLDALPSSTATYRTLYLDHAGARAMEHGDMTFAAEAAAEPR